MSSGQADFKARMLVAIVVVFVLRVTTAIAGVNEDLRQAAQGGTAPTVTDPVIAAIVTQAMQNLASGQPLLAVVEQALKSAADSGVSLQNLSPALAQSLMQAGLATGADGTVLAGQITSAFLAALTAQGADSTTIIQTISLMAQGIGAAAADNGLDATAVFNQIMAAVTAQGDNNAGQLVQVVSNVAARLGIDSTPPPPPPPPSNVPSNVSNTFDPTASPAR